MRLYQLVLVAWVAVGMLFAGLGALGNLKPKAVREGCAQETWRSSDPDDIVNQVCRR
jgi:hypothetical protein